MPSKLPRTLQDIKENIDLAQSFVANMSFADFNLIAEPFTPSFGAWKLSLRRPGDSHWN